LAPIQIKLARTAIGLGVRELAQAADVAPSTITRFESGKGGMQTRTLARVQQMLEDAGVIFIAADANGGPGVRLKV
jgi:transcriptional regulator with XRE-family HTH domain